MAWARVDDGWWCHPKVLGLDLAARGLWVSALSWSCAQRRSLIPTALVAMLGGTEANAKQLEANGLWRPVDGGWEVHDWAEYQDMSLSEKRAQAGRKGGKRSKPPKQTPADPGCLDKQDGSNREATAEAGTHPFPSQPNPEDQPMSPDPSPGSAVVPVDDAPAPPRRQTYPDDFEAFWQVYPRKTGKGAAAKAFAKATGGSTIAAQRITLEAERHAAAWGGWPSSDRQFIPHPATWLNECRFDDPPPEARRGGSGSRVDANRERIERSMRNMGVGS